MNTRTCCYHCVNFEYQVPSSRTVEIHNRNLHNEDEKYSCDICGFYVLQNTSLARHKKFNHECVKLCCRECNFKATIRGDVVQHQRALHDGIKYRCRQCNHQESSKTNLTQKGSLRRYQIPLQALQISRNFKWKSVSA